MQSRRELLTAVYAAFNRRDIEGVLARMRPHVDWPNRMEGGRVHGYDEVRAYWRRQWGILDPHVEPVRMEDDETGNTVVDVHQVVCDLSGNILKDQIVQHVYFLPGRPDRTHGHPETRYWADARKFKLNHYQTFG